MTAGLVWFVIGCCLVGWLAYRRFRSPVADEPVADEPVADEPVADEPVADEPVADEPVADEPVADTVHPPMVFNPMSRRMVKQLPLVVLLLCLPVVIWAGDTVFNPFTGKLDYVAAPGTGGAVTGNSFKAYTSLHKGTTLAFIPLDVAGSNTMAATLQLAGNTLAGNSISGGNSTETSTTHTTKGKMLKGPLTIDEVNGRVGIGVATPTATLHIAGTKIKLLDTQTSGFSSAASGQIFDYGANYNQLGDRNNLAQGGFFRIDLRDAQASEFFNITSQPAGGGETQIFKVSRTGVVVAAAYDLSALNTDPTSATTAGVPGEHRTTALFNYDAIATNTWRRTPIDAWPLAVYANNAAAIAGGLVAGQHYRTGADPDPVMVVH